jgi:hypothetical protein
MQHLALSLFLLLAGSAEVPPVQPGDIVVADFAEGPGSEMRVVASWSEENPRLIVTTRNGTSGKVAYGIAGDQSKGVTIVGRRDSCGYNPVWGWELGGKTGGSQDAGELQPKESFTVEIPLTEEVLDALDGPAMLQARLGQMPVFSRPFYLRTAAPVFYKGYHRARVVPACHSELLSEFHNQRFKLEAAVKGNGLELTLTDPQDRIRRLGMQGSNTSYGVAVNRVEDGLLKMVWSDITDSGWDHTYAGLPAEIPVDRAQIHVPLDAATLAALRQQPFVITVPITVNRNGAEQITAVTDLQPPAIPYFSRTLRDTSQLGITMEVVADLEGRELRVDVSDPQGRLLVVGEPYCGMAQGIQVLRKKDGKLEETWGWLITETDFWGCYAPDKEPTPRKFASVRTRLTVPAQIAMSGPCVVRVHASIQTPEGRKSVTLVSPEFDLTKEG